jgi:hypothetical protein
VTHASTSNTNAFAQNPFFALSTKMLNIYSDAIRQNMENLTVSSAKIIVTVHPATTAKNAS